MAGIPLFLGVVSTVATVVSAYVTVSERRRLNKGPTVETGELHGAKV